METKTKQPLDVEDFDISFASKFPSDDTIISVVTELDTEDELEITSTAISGLIVKVWTAGGVDGTTYKVTVRASTSGGRVKEIEFRLRVRDI